MQNHRCIFAIVVGAFFAIALPVISPSLLFAQTGSLSGKLTEAGTGAPVGGVRVKAMLANDTNIASISFSNARGNYHFKKLQPGSYRVSFSFLGYQWLVKDGVQIDAGKETDLANELQAQAIVGEAVVVSASRHEEEQTNAPASISVLPMQDIQEHHVNVPTEYLMAVPGVDISQENLTNQSISDRGMNTLLHGKVAMMTDYRMTEVPGIGGSYGAIFAVGQDDIDHVEVVRGPGAALYGPAAAQGMVHYISRSPFASQGTSLSITGGERSLFGATLRNAGTIIPEHLAYKISGKYLSAVDWMGSDSIEMAVRAAAKLRANLGNDAAATQIWEDTEKIGRRDPHITGYGFEASLSGILADDMTMNLTGGLNKITNIKITETLGADQIKDWLYEFGQLRFNWKDLFIQGYVNHDNTGTESYYLRSGAPIIDHSWSYTAQAQHHLDIGTFEQLTYGAEYNAVNGQSDSAVYGRNEGKANVQTIGAYLQAQTHIIEHTLDLVLAGRYDHHSELSGGFVSPRAAVIWHPDEDQTLRAIYNHAYSLPTIGGFYYDILQKSALQTGLPFDLRYAGTRTSGLNYAQDASGGYSMYSPFVGPTTAIPVSQSASALWQVLQGASAAKAAGVGVDISKIAAPTPAQVSSYMAYLNLYTNKFDAVTAPTPIPEVKPLLNDMYELDYDAHLSKDVHVELDVYQAHYSNFTGPATSLNPNVLVNFADMQKYLASSLIATGMNTDSANAKASTIAAAMARVPLGTVSAVGALHPTDVMIGTGTYYGDIKYYGADLMLDYRVNDMISIHGGFSWLSKNYWSPQDLGDTTVPAIPLQVPKYKSILSVQYRAASAGLMTEVRYRWADGFKQLTAAYKGDVPSRHLIDLTVGWRPSFDPTLLLTLSISNLLDNKHQEFIGAPMLGRLASLTLGYTLPTF